MTTYYDSFSSASGSWDAAGNWSAGAVPDQNTTVALGPNASLVTAAGNDGFAQLDAIGAAAGGAQNTLAVTGTLADPNGNSGIHQITDFTVDVASGASLVAPQLASFSGSVLDDAGLVNINGGGGIGAVSNSALRIETTGSLAAQQIGGFSGSSLDDFGAISLTGGGGLGNVGNSSITIERSGSLAAQQISALSNSSLDIEGQASLSGGGGIGNVNNSTITIGKHGSLTTAQISGNGSDTLVVNGSLLFNSHGGDGLNGTNVTINAGGTLTNDGYDSGNQSFAINGGTFVGADAYPGDSFNFNGVAGGVVDLPNDNRYGDNFTVSNFAAGDNLILGAISNNDSLTLQLANGTLTIRDPSIQTSPYYTDPNILYEVNNFSLAAGTSLSELQATIVNGQVELVACFYAGTRLATPDGEIAVEDIVPGALLMTASGDARPVRWLGRSTVAQPFADPLRSLPIRIRTGALAPGLPARDLLVSPCHALFVGEALIEAGALVNGVTILRETDVPDSFVWYHVELASHELLLAEGAATESFVDNVDRMHFDNWAEHEALGVTAPIAELPHPRARAHRQVPMAVRRLLAGRAAPAATAAATAAALAA